MAEVSSLHILCAEDGDGAARRGFERGRILADAENLARTYQSRPGNVAETLLGTR